MSFEELLFLVIAVLSGLLVLSHVFWFYYQAKLLNKIMSRNYTEYVQAEAFKKQKKKEPEFKIEEIDPIAEKQAQEINSLMGIV